MSDEYSYGPLCTFAVTGPTNHFQPIYVCHTCTRKKNQDTQSNDACEEQQPMPLCICYNCAEICHEAQDHLIEYIGDGPSYCDCISFSKDTSNTILCCTDDEAGNDCNSCHLKEMSEKVASKLGIQCDGNNIIQNVLGFDAVMPEKDNDFRYFYDIYDIRSLRPCNKLIQQSLELIRHSKDTHWLSWQTIQDQKSHEESESLCDLEHLACSIFKRHMEAYDLATLIDENRICQGGAEWWVQVKRKRDIDDDDDDNDDDDTNINKGSSKSKEAIDLHYDKDEELASAFDIGCFPTLSTVTYLTDSIYSHNGDGTYNSASPTLVFSHIHEMINHGPIGKTMRQTENDEDENNPQLIICHAREGKHLVFDGRLLHGAPSNPLLKQKVHADNNSTTSISIEDNKGLRVTFLVNIWLTRRPSRVFALPEKIRSAVKDSVSNPPTAHDYSGIQALEMIRKEVKKIRVTSRSSDDTKESRIKLPFVSNDATEGEYSDPDDIDDASCLIVSMVPPPKYDASDDTILVCYDKASVPCLEYTMEGESQDEYEEEELNL